MRALLTVAALALPVAAGAQYVRADRQEAYQPLDGGVPVPFPEGLDVDATVAIGFDFYFYGMVQKWVNISSNGTLHFGDVPVHDAVPQALPSVQPPFGIIAPWWADLGPTTRVATRLEGRAPARRLWVEWRDAAGAADGEQPGYGVSFQVVLFEGHEGRFELRYGPPPPETARMAGSQGFSDSLGERGMGLAACSPSCGAADWPGRSADAPENVRSLAVGDGFDLTPSVKLLAAVCQGTPPGCGGRLTADLQLAVQNLGARQGPAHEWTVHLSADRQPDAGDALIASGSDAAPIWPQQRRLLTRRNIAVPASYITGAIAYLIAEVRPLAMPLAGDDVNPGNDRVVVPVALPSGDLALEGLTAPVEAFLGEEIEISVQLVNQGTSPVEGARVGVLLSDNAFVSLLDDTLLHVTGPHRLERKGATGSRKPLSLRIPIPWSTGLDANPLEGDFFVGVFADPYEALAEESETNNIPALAEMKLLIPRPDLAVPHVVVPDSAHAGETFAVRRVLSNIGVRAADFEYAAYLSSNDIVTTEDILVATGTARVPPGGLDSGWVTATVPAGLSPGSYHLGVIANPFGQVRERSLTNNVGVALDRIEVVASGLVLITDSLPDAVVGVPYRQALVAGGGQGGYRFGLVSGELPPGITLDADGGLHGVARGAGEATLGIEVQSAGERAYRNLVLRVLDPGGPLGVATAELPHGWVGRGYRAGLVAVGGVPPYRWTAEAVDGGFPPGITVSAEGLLSGSPELPGAHVLLATVTDDRGGSAQARLPLRITPVGTLVIAGIVEGDMHLDAPADALVGQDYQAQFEAVGGTSGEIRWELTGGRLPRGLALEAGTGRVAGSPLDWGRFHFELTATDSDGAMASATFLLRVIAGRIPIATREIPPAQLGMPYEAALRVDAVAGEVAREGGGVAWRLRAGELPAGLSLDATGVIRGVPDATAQSRTHTFSVEASDGAGRVGTTTLALEVRPAGSGGGTKQGCGGGPVGLISLLGLAVAVRPWRRRWAGIALTLLAVAGPAGAVEVDYFHVQEAAQLVPPGGQEVFAVCDDDAENIPLPSGFAFSFYGEPVTQIRILCDGVVTFATDSTDQMRQPRIPLTGEPNMIFAWADDLVIGQSGQRTPSRITAELVGTAPDRIFAVTWENAARFQSGVNYGQHTTYTFQLQLLESGKVRVVHGAPAQGQTTPIISAAVGIQSDQGARFRAACSGCGFAAYQAMAQAGKAQAFGRAPDLKAEDILAAPIVHQGAQVRAGVVVRNQGHAATSPREVELWLSQDETIGAGDVRLGTASLDALEPGASTVARIDGALTVPRIGQQYIIGRIMPGNPPELDITNNVVTRGVTLAEAIPDLAVVPLGVGDGPLEVNGTGTLKIRLENRGAKEGVADVSAYLSLNDYVSPADVAIGTVAGVAVAANGSVEVEIPLRFEGTGAGRYRMGAVADPANALPESEESNNAGALEETITLGGPLELRTIRLETAVLGVSYAVRLVAAGGDGAYTWSLRGSPPPGLTLDSATGLVSGTPTATGSYRLEVELASAGETLPLSLPLQVVETIEPLAVVSAQLPWGMVRSTYETRLVATGGSPPYRWTVAGDPPAGLTVTEDGAVEGVPRIDGEHALFVSVTDAAQTTALATVRISIVPPGRLAVTQKELGDARLHVPYHGGLRAVGGSAPYSWLVVESRRLPATPGETAMAYPCAMPPGLQLGRSGTIQGKPTRTGLYAVAVRVFEKGEEVASCPAEPGVPMGGQMATLLLQVEPDASLSITTTALPDAQINQFYGARLSIATAADTGRIEFSVVEEEAGGLPDGLTLTAEGIFAGRPTREGHFAFLVRAEDGFGRWDLRPLAIRVGDGSPRPMGGGGGGGCQSGASGALSLVVAALALAFNRARSRARALAPLVILASLAVGGAACSKSSASGLCASVQCSEGSTCDPTEGVCRCGGAGGAVCATGEACDTVTFTCVAIHCEQAGCGNGFSCDRSDGRCKCGPASELCARGETCDPALGCLTGTACAAVSCAQGETCDPADGLCKCGGGVCGADAQCISGVCRPVGTAEGRCVGVACTGGTRCDPADGRCRCGGEGGEICRIGSVCREARCQAADLCARRNCSGAGCAPCPAGAGCDPSDGLCKCGGPPGAVCGPNQTCDVQAGQCVGGDPCLGRTCDGALSCDPEDGLCKCGGLGGALCGTDQVCAVIPSGARCVTPCDPLRQDCQGGDGCFVEGAQAYCSPPGPLQENDPCENVGDCARGLHCYGSPVSPTNRICTRYCDPSASPPPCRLPQVCIPMEGEMGERVGICARAE
jgi:hypothetical protein